MAKRIKVWLNFARAKAGDLITRAIAVYEGLKNNPHFPNLPFDIEELRALIDAFRASNIEAMDGSTQARAQRDSDREVLVDKMRTLAHYVEDNCKGEDTIFLTSGFELRPTGRTQTPPLGERIRSIKSSDRDGEAFVMLIWDPDAYSYEMRWALYHPDTGPGDWTEVPVATTRPATRITGLIPGATYAFQVRAVYEKDYTNWTDSVIWLCS
jgi:hypothetical protein